MKLDKAKTVAKATPAAAAELELRKMMDDTRQEDMVQFYGHLHTARSIAKYFPALLNAPASDPLIQKFRKAFMEEHGVGPAELSTYECADVARPDYERLLRARCMKAIKRLKQAKSQRLAAEKAVAYPRRRLMPSDVSQEMLAFIHVLEDSLYKAVNSLTANAEYVENGPLSLNRMAALEFPLRSKVVNGPSPRGHLDSKGKPGASSSKP
jgi:hypothetical protein